MIVYLARFIPAFVMYCVNGASPSSLLIESFTSCGAYVNLRYMARVYTHSIVNQLYNTIVVFKLGDIVPSASYSSVCNVLSQWSISLLKKKRTKSRDRCCCKKEQIQ